MSLQDDLSAVRHRLDDLVRAVERLERSVATTGPAHTPGPPRTVGPDTRPDGPALVPVPDTPYDSSLWTDSDDEGLGVRNRRAP
ncbi:hypothetical protein [Streptomyces paludis]|uniref:Uncharacterized protein n=1 Tax=Streptomyces paludis TaxID=2282738 RepID=A0A345HTP0_9ACTN|nr:hypothetical protein [Streptomyces paludis]AXG80064.1 hypothetical protein DVK44_23095 [Streptomyces paludis]